MKDALSARGGASHCAVLHVSRGPGTPPVPLWHRASHEVLGLDLSAWTPQRADLGPWCPSTCKFMALTFCAARSPSVREGGVKQALVPRAGASLSSLRPPPLSGPRMPARGCWGPESHVG